MSDPHTQPLRFVSVRLTSAGRSQTVSIPDALAADALRPGTSVVVETPNGETLASVESRVPQAVEGRVGSGAEQRRVTRIATRDDEVTRLTHEQREAEARRVAQARIRERGLAMKLTKVEQAFDGSRLLFYFTADERVDFRELVRDLAAVFHTRIEMRHIGVRDEAQTLGGYGTCGRPLCCSTFLTSFAPVSIKMAKQQNLSLSPSKLSGMCGRLKCCLRFEMSGGEERGAGDRRAAEHPGSGSESTGKACGCRSGGCSGCAGGSCGRR